MKYLTLILILILILPLFYSCSRHNNEDEKLINELNKKWDSSYSIIPTYDIYLSLRSKSNKVNENEIKNIFSDFFIRKGTDRDSFYIYLNIYDKHNTFLYQLYYDRNKKKIIKCYQEAY